MKSKRTTVPSEHQIQTEILHYLFEKQIFAYRNNSGAAKIGKRFVQFGWPGMPDIVAVVNGKYVGIEVKRPGAKQSELQESFQNRLERAGGKYILAMSLSGAINNIQSI